MLEVARPVPLLLPGGSTISGTLTSDDTWGPGAITVTGDIVITSSTTITIVPGTLVQMTISDTANLGLDAQRVEFIVRGALRVNGPVTFTTQSGSPAGGDWYGLRFSSGSSGTVDRATLEYGVVGISIDNASPDVTNSIIRYMHGRNGTNGTNGGLNSPGGPGTYRQPGLWHLCHRHVHIARHSQQRLLNHGRRWRKWWEWRQRKRGVSQRGRRTRAATVVKAARPPASWLAIAPRPRCWPTP